MRNLPDALIQQDVIVVPAELRAVVAARLAAEAPANVVVVVDASGSAIGVLGRVEIRRHAGIQRSLPLHPSVVGAFQARVGERPVAAFMLPIDSIPAHASRAQAAAAFLETGSSYLPVGDDAGRPVGLLSRDAVLFAVASNPKIGYGP